MANVSGALNESLHTLRGTNPPSLLAPNPAVSETARAASRQLFSAIRPCSLKSPLDELLVEGFDAEQIWHQIDLMSQPLISSLCRGVKRFVKNPEGVSQMKGPNGKMVEEEKQKDGVEEWGDESDGFDEELEGVEEEEDEKEEEEERLAKVKKGRKGEEDEQEDDDDDADEEAGSEEESDEEMEDEEGERVPKVKKGRKGDDDEEEDEEEEGDGEGGDRDRDGGGGGIEDEFLKIDELSKYLDKEENFDNGVADEKSHDEEDDTDEDSFDDDDDEEEEEKEEGEESDEDTEFGLGDDEDEAEDMENARYEDFFGTTGKGKGSKKKAQLPQDSGDSDDEDDDMEFGKQKKWSGSTHQKQLEKIQSKIEQMEKANLEPKTWTMQGEVTAAKRPKNSALEVDLDFDHNVRPAPVITEEVTASIEDMIKKRIIEGQFNDVQRAPKLPSKAPREVKELDDNKSKQGLAEIYEQEYVQKKDPTSAPLSFTDELKNQGSILFKQLGLKLDALSHFHFAPKPVIEDMSIQANVPALAMEEIAPVAVSDAAMLAPEEVFHGKGDIKEEAELTKEERRRRRAKKKRKFKAVAVKNTGTKVQTKVQCLAK